MSRIKISVIIPVKNRPELLAQTLNALLNQSYKPHEIIVVDDSSSDNFEKLHQQYANQVVFVASKGSGPGAARNTGLELASGDAIQFFDSDDILTSNKLETQAMLLAEQSLDFVYGPYVKAQQTDTNWLQVGAVMQYEKLPDSNLSDLVLQGWCLLTQSALFHKDFLKSVGYWRTDLMPHEDWEYWFRIAKQKPKYAHENLSCVIYRQHGDQITDRAVKSKARSLDGIKAGEVIKSMISRDNSWHSRVVFEGHQAYLIDQLNKILSLDNRIPQNEAKKASIFYFLLWSRFERFRSGTGWMRFHGATTSKQIFDKYLKLLS